MTEMMTVRQCGHCGMWHTGECPRIKAVEYHPNGTVKRVEYHPPGNWFWSPPAPDKESKE